MHQVHFSHARASRLPSKKTGKTTGRLLIRSSSQITVLIIQQLVGEGVTRMPSLEGRRLFLSEKSV